MQANQSANWEPYLEKHQTVHDLEGDLYLDVTHSRMNCLEALYNYYMQKGLIKDPTPADI